MTITYLHGLGNHHESSAINGALVEGCNSPQKVPFGLYAEQISGSAFTVSRANNLRSWVYRIRPSVLHGEYRPLSHPNFRGAPFSTDYTPPNPMRWNPMPYSEKKHDLIDGLFTLAGHGDNAQQTATSIHFYTATCSMQRYFSSSDGEWLVVPQEGALLFHTEFGLLDVKPGEIIVIPRGIKFRVTLLDEKARGYICENGGLPFRLPDLGLIGANGLANPRDFKIPTAAFETTEGELVHIQHYQGRLWQTELTHSPLDVVAWHGNYVPYKYDLSLFNTVNTVSYDHPDPSIFTVLTSPSAHPGIAHVDFVIFPPRWMVAADTFRPPYYHRNVMSEFMGLIYGEYDAKPTGFTPGGASLHNAMVAHGPDAEAYEKAIQSNLAPHYLDKTLAFMFEARSPWYMTQNAYEAPFRQNNYQSCWQGLSSHFKAQGTEGATHNLSV